MNRILSEWMKLIGVIILECLELFQNREEGFLNSVINHKQLREKYLKKKWENQWKFLHKKLKKNKLNNQNNNLKRKKKLKLKLKKNQLYLKMILVKFLYKETLVITQILMEIKIIPKTFLIWNKQLIYPSEMMTHRLLLYVDCFKKWSFTIVKQKK